MNSIHDKRVIFNVSGEIFETYERTLLRYPNTLLGEEKKRRPYRVSGPPPHYDWVRHTWNGATSAKRRQSFVHQEQPFEAEYCAAIDSIIPEKYLKETLPSKYTQSPETYNTNLEKGRPSARHGRKLQNHYYSVSDIGECQPRTYATREVPQNSADDWTTSSESFSNKTFQNQQGRKNKTGTESYIAVDHSLKKDPYNYPAINGSSHRLDSTNENLYFSSIEIQEGYQNRYSNVTLQSQYYSITNVTERTSLVEESDWTDSTGSSSLYYSADDDLTFDASSRDASLMNGITDAASMNASSSHQFSDASSWDVSSLEDQYPNEIDIVTKSESNLSEPKIFDQYSTSTDLKKKEQHSNGVESSTNKPLFCRIRNRPETYPSTFRRFSKNFHNNTKHFHGHRKKSTTISTKSVISTESTYHYYFFDRRKQFFEAILFFYQSNGILLCPADAPLSLFIDECRFFQIPEKDIDSMKTKAGILPELQGSPYIEDKSGTFRACVWNIVENPESSLAARIFTLVSLGAILCSVTCSVLETVKALKFKSDKLSENPWAATELGLNIWFFIELITRFASSPSKLDFIRNELNWMDAICIIPYFFIIIFSISADILKFLRIFRVFRVVRLSTQSIRLHIVSRIILTSFEDFQLLVASIGIMVVACGSILYYLEGWHRTFQPIPNTFYWGVVTITTVGYGDIVPLSTAGKILTTVFMILGCITMSLPVLSIVMKFMYYYEKNVEDANNKDKYVEEEEKKLRKMSVIATAV